MTRRISDFLQRRQKFFVLLSLGDVARDAGKKSLPVFLKLAERKLKRNFLSALVKPGQFDGFPGNVFLSRLDVI